MRSLKIDLLKLLILLGISAGLLPTRIKGLNNWFTNYIVADASDDVEQHLHLSQQQQQQHVTNSSANVTSLVNGTVLVGDQQLPTYNFSDSIVRVGAQSPGAVQNESQQSGGLESNQTTQHEQVIDQLTSRQDNINPTTVNYSGSGGASNHKNYPIEPYPSASYTSLALQVPSPTTTSNASPLATSSSSSSASSASSGPSNGAAQASTLNSLLNRDYHHSFNLSEHNSHNNLLSPNHRTNVPSSQGSPQVSLRGQAGGYASDAQTAYAQILNHNFENNYNSGGGGGGSDLLNTGLIQNLTAGLFPVHKLSNATLLSLSELLSKTKQQQQQQQTFQASNLGASNNLYASGATTGPIANGYRPSLVGTLTAASSAQSYQMPAGGQQQASNYLEALLGDHRFTSSMLDYLNQPSGQLPSQFGFREPSSTARLQSSSSSSSLSPSQLTASVQYQRPVTLQSAPGGANNQQKFPNGAANYQTASIPSNVYNTYAPYKEQQSASNKQQPPVTNGQMLNMAATLYDNYLDQNYRANQQYQFVQQHQANNQNHLDKVVYHSTPFRPSIVSPPSSSQTLAATTTSTSGANGPSHQRPRTEADVKSVSHASLNGNSNHVMTTNGQQQQQQLKLGAYQPGRQVALGSTKFDDAFDSPFNAVDQQSRFTGSGTYQQSGANSSRFAPQTSGGQQQQQAVSAGKPQSGGSAAAATAQRQQPATSAAAQSAAALVGPQLLLDLYERAIDSQIQEAIYSDHQQHFQHLAPLAAAAAASSSPGNAAAGSTTAATNSNAWPTTAAAAVASYDDTPPFEPTSYTTPALTASGSSRQPTSSMAAMAALMNSQQSQQQSLDPLASALSELPTFSASDLQPLVPGSATSEPVYSLMPPGGGGTGGAGGHSSPMAPDQSASLSDASSLAALIAQFTSGPQSTIMQQSQQTVPSASSLHQLLLGDYDQFGSVYGPSALPMASTVSPQTTVAMTTPPPIQSSQLSLGGGGGGSSSSTTSGGGGNSATSLPSIFTKFTQGGGQLSSIFTSPFAHLYANLPRYRYTKQKQTPVRDQQQLPTTTTTTTTSQFSAASGLSKQQAAAAMAASAAANLIASSGHSLTPLQAAMLQAQLATSAYLQADPSGVEQAAMASSTGIGSYSTPATDFSTPGSGGGGGGGLLGLAGGGVSPAVWRSILSPIIGARKQQTQNTGGNQSNGSQKQTITGGGNIYHQQRPVNSVQSLALMNSLLGSGGAGGGSASSSFGQLLSTAASSTQSTGSYVGEQPPRSGAHEQRKARLKIKILKIPVAFYDAASASSSAAGSHTAAEPSDSISLGSSISLMPAHLQPSPTASLLASLAACPYHAQQAHQQTLGGPAFAYTSQSSPMSSLLSLPGYSSPTSAADFSSPWSQSSLVQFNAQTRTNQNNNRASGAKQAFQQGAGGSSTLPSSSSSLTTSGSTTTGSNSGPNDHGGKPTPIRDFTDINQPNDLQVSPSTASNIPTATHTQQQQQHSQHHLRKSRAKA